MPALRIAALTASATFSTIAGRPISSGKSSALIAVPTARRDFDAAPVLPLLANTVACGVITPSQPPDQTIGMAAISASLRLPCFRSARRKAWSARIRVKSFTPPLPSVLPMTAITSSAVNWPRAMQASSPEASCTVLSSTFATSIAIRPSPSRLCVHSRRAFAPHHPFVARPAVDHRRRRSTLRAQIGPQLCRRRRIEIVAVGSRAGAQHDAIIIPRRLIRHAALGHIARDQLRLALERITPAAAAGRDHAHHLSRQDGLAVDQATEIARRPFEVDRDAERPSGPSTVDAVAAEPHPVGGDDGAAIHQRAVVLLVPEAAPPLAGAAGIRAQRELLDQQRKPRLGELGRLIARVRHDVNGVASVGIVSTARAAAEHLAREKRLAVGVLAEEAGVTNGLLVGRHPALDRLRHHPRQQPEAPQQHERARIGRGRPLWRDSAGTRRRTLAYAFVDV